MTTLEKKVDALCRMSLAPDDSVFNSAAEELRELMGQSQSGCQGPASMRVLIKNALNEIGFPHGIKGRKYMEDAIALAIHQPECLNKITGANGLYAGVAQLNDTTLNRAERAIRHGIELAWTRGDPDIHQRYFGGTVDPNKGKPTNREFIAAVSQYIQREF